MNVPADNSGRQVSWKEFKKWTSQALLLFVCFVAVHLWFRYLSPLPALSQVFSKTAQLIAYYYALWAYFHYIVQRRRRSPTETMPVFLLALFCWIWLQTATFSLAVLIEEKNTALFVARTLPTSFRTSLLVLTLPFIVALAGFCSMMVWLYKEWTYGSNQRNTSRA